MKAAIFATALLFGFCAQAENALKNFTPGAYSLKSGTVDNCGESEFKITDTAFIISSKQDFTLNNNTQTFHGDAPGDEACVYEVKNTMDTSADKTLLASTDDRTCDGAHKYTLTKQAEVRDGQVKVDVIQKGTPQFHYSCVWKKKAKK